jgi:hypothetical protein
VTVPPLLTTEAIAARVTREDCVKFLAVGHTGSGLRAMAADPETVTALTAGGDTEETARAMMHALADGIEQLIAEGLTMPGCWDLLGWDLDHAEAVIRSLGGAR